MKKEKVRAEMQRLQTRLVVWCVLTICFYVIATFNVLAFVRYIAWLSSIYCIFLLGTWISLWWTYRHGDK